MSSLLFLGLFAGVLLVLWLVIEGLYQLVTEVEQQCRRRMSPRWRTCRRRKEK